MRTRVRREREALGNSGEFYGSTSNRTFYDNGNVLPPHHRETVNWPLDVPEKFFIVFHFH